MKLKNGILREYLEVLESALIANLGRLNLPRLPRRLISYGNPSLICNLFRKQLLLVGIDSHLGV